jgi:hypothetical protein
MDAQRVLQQEWASGWTSLYGCGKTSGGTVSGEAADITAAFSYAFNSMICLLGSAENFVYSLQMPDNIQWFCGARFILALCHYRNTAAMDSQGLQSVSVP